MVKKKLNLKDPGIAKFPALNFNTNDISCATGLAQLQRIKDTISKRKKFIKQLNKKILNSQKHVFPIISMKVFHPFITQYL